MQVYDIHLNKQRREETRHGSFALPLAVYTTVIRRNVLGFVNWHWHEELQFCLVTRGAVEFHVSETVLSLSPGQGIFINAGQLHMARDGDGQGAYLCLDFHPRLIAGTAGGAVERDRVTPYVQDRGIVCCPLLPSVPWQREALDKLQILLDTDREDALALVIRLLELWQVLETGFLRPAHRGHPQSPQRQPVREMAQFIHDHFDQELTLDQIAASAALSPGACCRLFKRHMGCSPFTYVQNLRLQRAARLLETTDEPITQAPPGAATAAPAISPSPFGRRRACPPPPIGSGCLEKTREIDKISTKCYFKCSMYPDVEVFP